MVKSLTKTGRPRAVYKTSWGDQVPGLMRLADGRWRISGPDKHTFTEADERIAVARFHQLIARKGGDDTVALPVGIAQNFQDVLPLVRKAAKQSITISFGRTIDAPDTVERNLDSAEVWAFVRQALLTKPAYVAKMVGIEQLGYLADLPKPTISPTLQEVFNLYINRPKISANWRAKCKQFWGEFVDCVKVTKLREVTQENIIEYGDEVEANCETPTYARHRYGAIKTIINYPTKRGKWAEDCKRTLAFCAALVPPKKSAADPKPIEPKDFRALLNKSDAEMKAILLLALNCCMYAAEVGAILWSEIDLEKGVLISERNKTGIVRIATLWPETIAAVKQIRRKTDALFLTAAGTQANSLSIYRLFKIVRKAASLNTLQFSQIRDGAYTYAVEAGIDLNICRLLAGHATGISDHYVKRRPQMVAAACNAIHKAYAPLD